MFAGVGTGAFGAGIFHLYTHAFFKAGLFLCAGSVMHAMSGSGDITKMGGLRKYLPIDPRRVLRLLAGHLRRAAVLGLLLQGRHRRRGVRHAHLRRRAWPGWGRWSGAMLLIAALCTAFYMSRLYFLVFTGAAAGRRPDPGAHPRVAGRDDRAAGGAGHRRRRWAASSGIPGALFGHPEWNLLGHWLEPALGPEMHIDHALEVGVMAASTVIAAAGHRAGLRVLRRRLPRAGHQVRRGRSRASSRWCATSSGSTSCTSYPDHPAAPGAVPGAVPGGRPHPDRPGAGARRGPGGRRRRAHQPHLPGGRRAALPGGVRRRACWRCSTWPPSRPPRASWR